ncbi:MAG TPA: hypothetical protein VNQ76_09205 [Planctomicrobium sp.]|nr:hypothetical protein [Planctomicrobium sp.]
MPNGTTEAAERLQLRMQRIRRRLDVDVDDIINDAQQLLDWKYYLRRQPIASVIGLAVVGYFLVPSKKTAPIQKIYLDPGVSRDVVQNAGPIQVSPSDNASSTEAAPGAGLLLSLGTLALNMAVRTGMNYGIQFVREAFIKEVMKPDAPASRQNTSESIHK